MKQANFSVVRDLDLINSNNTNCSLWATRLPTTYYSYGASNGELRNAAAGTTTYVAGGHTYTVPIPGQYVNAAGTGASGGTVSYNAGTNTFSVTLGSGNFVDKQSFLVLAPSSGSSGNLISLNGNTAVPIVNAAGNGARTINSGAYYLMFYDAAIGSILTTSGAGFNCPTPPEVFIELNAELGTTPWFDGISYAQDPMTDWVAQEATYIKTNYPLMKPIFEVLNELATFSTNSTCYASAKSAVYIAEDAAWTNGLMCGGSGNGPAEAGKMASTMGQDLTSILGAGNYDLLCPMMPASAGTPSSFGQCVTGVAYANQTIAPTQTGYTQAAASNYVTNVSNNNYWSTGFCGANCVNQAPRLRGLEAGIAYCYYNYSISTACQGLYASQAAVMTQYFSTSNTSAFSIANIASLITELQSYQIAAANCFTTSCPVGSALNQTSPIMFYEGGFANNGVPANLGTANVAQTNSVGDIMQPIGLSSGGQVTAGSYSVLAATTNTCQINSTGNPTLTINNNGCVVGMTVAIAGTFNVVSTTASAGWSAGAGSIQVASCASVAANQWVADSTTGNVVGVATGCSGTTLTISNSGVNSDGALNSGSNGDALVFGTANITYTSSNTWVNYLRNLSYTAPDLTTFTTTLYNALVATGGKNPSQYQLASGGYFNGNEWLVLAYDIYGYLPAAKCTSCTIASTTLTLGGTITGVFATGQVLLGGGAITGPGTGAGAQTILGTCTPIGGNVCGTTSGDTFALNQASTVASGVTMTGNIAPTTVGSGTTSPVAAFKAICTWNGNGAAC